MTREHVAKCVIAMADHLLEGTADAAQHAYDVSLEVRCSTRTRGELRAWRDQSEQRLAEWRTTATGL